MIAPALVACMLGAALAAHGRAPADAAGPPGQAQEARADTLAPRIPAPHTPPEAEARSFRVNETGA